MNQLRIAPRDGKWMLYEDNGYRGLSGYIGTYATKQQALKVLRQLQSLEIAQYRIRNAE